MPRVQQKTRGRFFCPVCGKGAFSNSLPEEIELPDSVRQIAENAFLDCPRLVLRASETWIKSHIGMLNAIYARSKVAFRSL